MRKERRVQSEKQEPHTAMWGKTKAQHTERVGGKSVVSRSCWGSERGIKSVLDRFRKKLMCSVEGLLEVQEKLVKWHQECVRNSKRKFRA